MHFFFFKLLYKILVKYYLSDNIKSPLKDSAVGLGNFWTPAPDPYTGMPSASFGRICLYIYFYL